MKNNISLKQQVSGQILEKTVNYLLIVATKAVDEQVWSMIAVPVGGRIIHRQVFRPIFDHVVSSNRIVK